MKGALVALSDPFTTSTSLAYASGLLVPNPCPWVCCRQITKSHLASKFMILIGHFCLSWCRLFVYFESYLPTSAVVHPATSVMMEQLMYLGSIKVFWIWKWNIKHHKRSDLCDVSQVGSNITEASSNITVFAILFCGLLHCDAMPVFWPLLKIQRLGECFCFNMGWNHKSGCRYWKKIRHGDPEKLEIQHPYEKALHLGVVKLELIVASCRGFFRRWKFAPPFLKLKFFVFFFRADFKDVLGRMSWKPFGVSLWWGWEIFSHDSLDPLKKSDFHQDA